MEGRVLGEEAIRILRQLGPDGPLAEVPLSHRLRRALVRLGVEVLADAAELSERALTSQAGIGRKSVAELAAALAVHGLHLRGTSSTEVGQQQLPVEQGHSATAEPLRRELDELLRIGGVSEPDRGALTRVLGWDGNGGTSVKAVSEELGVSGERIRKVRAEASERLLAADPSTPVLDRAIAVLEETQPATLATAGAELCARGLCNASFDPRGVLRAAKLLGRKVRLVVDAKEPAILCRSGVRGMVAAVDVACTIALGGRAVATVGDVLAHLAEDQDAGRWRVLVADLVDASEALEWVDERRQSFGPAGVTEAVVAAAKRAVRRHGECTLERLTELFEADSGIGPGFDRKLVAHVCTRVAGLQLDGDVVREPPPPPAPPPRRGSKSGAGRLRLPALAPRDVDRAAYSAALVDVLRARPETTLEELCRTQGESGAWLRGSTIVDLALAAVEAGVHHQSARSLRSGTVQDAAGRPATDASPVAEPATPVLPASAPASDATPPQVDRPPLEASKAIVGHAAGRNADTWSSSASWLSVPIPASGHEEAPVLAERGQPTVADTDDPPPPEVGATEILDVLRSAAASGLTMVELEQRLPGPRSRLRRILGQLEADGAVSREGATRWTRYRIAGPRAEDREPNSAAPAGEPPRPTAPLRRRAVDRSPAIRTVYYKGAHSADAQTVATIVLHRGAVEIEYAPGQPRLHALERIATPDGVVTPQDGRRFWAALPSAFATNLRFFLAEGGTLASERADAGPQTVRASDEPGVRSSGEADPIGREPRR